MRRLVAWVVPFVVVLMFSLASSPLVQGGWVLPWGVERIHAGCVWDNNNDKMIDVGANAGQNVTIAVIDNGVYYYDDAGVRHYHPDLEGNIVGGCTFTYTEGYVDVDYGDYCDSPSSHGTHVTGTIMAVGNDGCVIGVSPRAKIYALKCASAPYWWWPSLNLAMEVAAAINWAIGPECNASLISISLGWNQYYQEVYQACSNAYEHGVLIVAAAGDDGNGPVVYPAACSAFFDTVVAVGDTYPDDTRFEDCNVGPELRFMAPGVNINSTTYDDLIGWTYEVKNGSSMAVPHVTGTAALVFKSKMDSFYDFDGNGKWDGHEVACILADYALPLGNFTEYGYGLVNPWESTQRPDGDVNNDLKTDTRDAAIVGRAFGSYPGHPLWQARADINVDNKVDVKDVAIVQLNIWKVDP